MPLDIANAGLFSLAALALLGSPGPGIAALIAVGRAKGFAGGLPFYGGMQIGLAVAAAISAGGLFSLLAALPYATLAMAIIATAYLIYLAVRVATAPVAQPGGAEAFSGTALGGALLGIANPKAYLAFVSLMAGYPIARTNPSADLALKWLICVVVMLVVDLAWLALGALVKRIALRPAAERALNIAMGATIALSALFALM